MGGDNQLVESLKRTVKRKLLVEYRKTQKKEKIAATKV